MRTINGMTAAFCSLFVVFLVFCCLSSTQRLTGANAALAPVARNDSINVGRSRSFDIDVLENDDANASGDLTIIYVSQPIYGNTSINGTAGHQYITYKGPAPKTGQLGPVPFYYIVKNSNNLTSIGWVNAVLKNTPPVTIDIVHRALPYGEIFYFDTLNSYNDTGHKVYDADGDHTFLLNVTMLETKEVCHNYHGDPNNVVCSTGIVYNCNTWNIGNFGDNCVSFHSNVWQDAHGVEVAEYYISDGIDATRGIMYFATQNNWPGCPWYGQPSYRLPKDVVIDMPIMDFGVDYSPHDIDGDKVFIFKVEKKSVSAPCVNYTNSYLTGEISYGRVGTTVQIVPNLASRDTKIYAGFLRNLASPALNVCYIAYYISDSDGYDLTRPCLFQYTFLNAFPMLANNSKSFTIGKNRPAHLYVEVQDDDIYDTLSAWPNKTLSNAGVSFTMTSNNAPMIEMLYINKVEKINVTRNTYTLHYTPIPNRVYNDAVNLTVFDGFRNSTVTLPIYVVNEPPVGLNKTVVYCSKNNGCIVDVLSGGNDPNGDPVSLDTTYTSTMVSGSSVSLVPGNAGALNFVPLQGYSGIASFTYRLTDALGNTPNQALFSAPAIVTVNVVNDAPVIADTSARSFSVAHASTQVLTGLLTGSSDPNGDEIFISRVSASKFADVVITISSDGKTLSYTSAVPHASADSFQYWIKDSEGAESTTAATVTISNQPPVALPISGVSTYVNKPVTIDVSSFISDPNGDAVSVVSVSYVGSDAVVSSSGAMSIVFTPLASINLGTVTFSYTVSDGALQATSTISVEVVADPTPPPVAATPSPAQQPSVPPQQPVESPTVATPAESTPKQVQVDQSESVVSSSPVVEQPQESTASGQQPEQSQVPAQASAQDNVAPASSNVEIVPSSSVSAGALSSGGQELNAIATNQAAFVGGIAGGVGGAALVVVTAVVVTGIAIALIAKKVAARSAKTTQWNHPGATDDIVV